MKISEYYEEKQVREFENTSGRDNILINGNFDIWQRGTSFAAIAANAYSVDRLTQTHVTDAVYTILRDTDVPTQAESGIKSNYSLKLDVTTADASITAGEYVMLQQRLEGYDFTPLVGKTATLSFWVKAVKAGIYCVNFGNNVDRSYIVEYTINTASTWEKKTVTLDFDYTGGTWDYTNGTGLVVEWCLAVGSTYQTTADAWQTGTFLGTVNQVNGVDSTDNNFWLAQIKLEEGSVATPFVPRPIGEELALCQRYYEKIGQNSIASGSATTEFITAIDFKVSKRTTPTIELLETSNVRFLRYGVGYKDAASPSISGSYVTTEKALISIIGFSGIATDDIAYIYGTTSGESEIFAFDAEL